MCGIFGYIGPQDANGVVINGLKALEYRGYDSAGIFTIPGGVVKTVGPVANLAGALLNREAAHIGIGHTRWAPHGQPTEINAHPHASGDGRLWIVHNGIIENYQAIKQTLVDKGHKFVSETDTEVLAHLIGEYYLTNELEVAVSKALAEVRGTYGLVVMAINQPDKFVAVRSGSPMVIGLGTGENFVASDPSAIVRYTKQVIYLNDGEMAVIEADKYQILSLDQQQIQRAPDLIDWDVEIAQKGGYTHFMLKEIMEMPEVLRNTARGRLVAADGNVKLGGLEDVKDQLRDINRIVLVGCGSAYYAGLVGKYIIEELAGVAVEVELGSELRNKRMVFDSKTAVVAITQSGETADTLAAIREAKNKGLLTLGVVNTVGSTIARETVAGIYNHAGPEIGVASTKAFVSQIEALMLIAIFLGRQRDMSSEQGRVLVEALTKIPDLVTSILQQSDYIAQICEKYIGYHDYLYIGRKYNYPIALEGALKLKEVSYVHAEGYAAGEMKHGPIAMIDVEFPTIAIALKDSVYDKMISNIQEIRARRGRVLAIATEGDKEIAEVADDVIYIPATLEVLSPLLAVVPLQLFAYHMGTHRAQDVDKPRNLAKSVTVE